MNKHLFFLCLTCTGGLSLLAPAMAAPVAAQRPQADLNAILQDMVKSNSDDFYAVAAAEYDAGGDMSSFTRKMMIA